MEESTLSFRNLVCYQKGSVLVKEIYKLVSTFPLEEKYALGDQLRRAAVSITSNIAEGSARQSLKDQSHFLEISYGSLMEVMSQIEIASDVNLVDTESFLFIESLIIEESRVLSGYRKSLLKRLNVESQIASNL